MTRIVRKMRRSKRAAQGSSGERYSPARREPSGAEEQPPAETNEADLSNLKAEIATLQGEIEAEGRKREALKAERLRLQEVLGAQHGKRVLPRLKVEKTNGVPSLVAGARMMQRIHAKADDPRAGLDGVGTVFADLTQTERFVRSHGVQVGIDLDSEPTAIVHAFRGRTPLIELRQDGRVKHVTSGGKDLGDIRPGVTHDPDIAVPDWLDKIVRSSRTLSGHISRPYVQIGWHEHDGAPFLSGIDASPHRIPSMTAEWDERLGRAFDRGHARMLMQPYRIGALDNRVPGGTFRYEEDV